MLHRRWRALLVVLWLTLAAWLAGGCSAEERAALDGQPADAAANDVTVDQTSPQSDGEAKGDAGIDGAASDAASTTRSIGGYVTGLRGSGLELSLGTEDIAVAASGGAPVDFTFATKLEAGASYTVTVKKQPTSPLQVCTVTGGSGVVGAADVTDIEIACESVLFSVGGHVLGLRGTGLTLRDNGVDDKTVAPFADAGADAAPPPVPFAFGTKLESGAAFDVTVATQPSSPSQTCGVSGGQGLIVSGDVTTVTVNCVTNSFTIGGSVTGLAGTGLKLKNNDTDEIAVNASVFSFPTAVKSGDPYAVTISAQPTNPWQTCDVTKASGNVGNANVNDIVVSCASNKYSVGGSVTGLKGSGLKLKNNDAEEISISGDGPFAFPTKLTSGSTYEVKVSADPTSPWQTCTVTNPKGALGGSDAKDIVVTCTTQSFKVGGNVTGSTVGSGFVLKNGAEQLSISQTGPFEFLTPVESGKTYSVDFATRPAFAACTLSGATGTVQGSNVGSVAVACSAGSTIGGSAGTSSQLVPPDTLLARSVSVASATTAHAIGGYWQSAGCSVKYGLYADAAGSPGALLGATDVVTTTSSGASEIALASPVAIAPGTYWIALLSLTACNGYYNGTGGTGYVAHPSVSFNSPLPDPFGMSVPGGPNYDLAFYLRVSP